MFIIIYKHRYAVVKSPGVLAIFKDEAASSRPPVEDDVREDDEDTGKKKDKKKNKGKDNDNANGELFSIRLPQVVTVEVTQKTGKDSSVHLFIELSEETLDLRVPAGQGDRTALEEAERWKSLLLAWKDYSIDHGIFLSFTFLSFFILIIYSVPLLRLIIYSVPLL